MSVSSTRAQAVAEILWELKRAEKLGDFTTIAGRAGFSPGSGGRSVNTCLRIVRRDWPHLQWWRAVPDNGQVEEEQATFLTEGGFETETVDGNLIVKSFEAQLMTWDESSDAEEGAEATSSEQ